MEPLAKGVENVAVGQRATMVPGKSIMYQGNEQYDYSHLLDPEHRKDGLKLIVDHSDHGQLAAHIFKGDEYVGGADGFMSGSDLHIDNAQVMDNHRGKGLGTPLYTALLTHGVKKFNANTWVGGTHSSSAHKLHQKIVQKYGLRYEGGLPSGRQAAPDGRFDGAHGPYMVSDLNTTIAKTEEALEKMLPTPTFPGLGVPDNRRETKLITTHLEHENAQRLMSQGRKTAPNFDNRNGIAVKNTRGVALSYSKDNQFRAPSSQGLQAPQATMLHEDLHRVFQRVGQQFGMEGRKKLATSLLDSIPRSLSSYVRGHARNVKIKQDATQGLEDEEALAHMLNYLNDGDHRARFHQKRGHSEGQARAYQTGMKRAYKHILTAARRVDPSWVQG